MNNNILKIAKPTALSIKGGRLHLYGLQNAAFDTLYSIIEVLMTELKEPIKITKSYNEEQVSLALRNIRLIFEDASSIIENLEQGEKITVTKLSDILAEKYNTKGTYLYHTLKFLFENYPGISKTAGAHGGIKKI